MDFDSAAVTIDSAFASAFAIISEAAVRALRKMAAVSSPTADISVASSIRGCMARGPRRGRAEISISILSRNVLTCSATWARKSFTSSGSYPRQVWANRRPEIEIRRNIRHVRSGGWETLYSHAPIA